MKINRIYIMVPFPLTRDSLLEEIEEKFIKENIDKFIFDDSGEFGNQVAYIDLDIEELGSFGFAIEGHDAAMFWSYPRFNEDTNLWENSCDYMEFSFESEL